MDNVIFKFKKKYGQVVKKILGKLVRVFEKNPCVIMYVDGGFSSQIVRYSKGMWFKEHGMNVKYDLTWYKKKGMDELGIEERPWRLSKCFPGLDLEIADDKEIRRYKRFYASNIYNMVDKYKGSEEEMRPPLYIDRYDFDYLISDFQLCTKYFNWQGMENIFCDEAKKTANDIKRHKQEGKKVIGVHVRRGDMTIVGGYWTVLTAKYFIKAIDCVATEECILYFFSNGFDFVKENIIPFINYETVLVDNHNEDYEDIYLYSLCDVQIASQGSWGAMAYAFNTEPDRKIVIPSHEKELCEDTSNTEKIFIYLEDDMYLQ